MMTEDDDSDDLEGDLELNEFVDKIKCFQSKSAKKIRKLKEQLAQKDEIIFNLRKELTKAQDELKAQNVSDPDLEELQIISPSKKKRARGSINHASNRSNSEEEVLSSAKISSRSKKILKTDEKPSRNISTSSNGNQMVASKLLNLKPKETLPVPKKSRSQADRRSVYSSRSRQSSKEKTQDISQHFIKKSSKVTPEKSAPLNILYSPLDDIELIDSSEDDDMTQISLLHKTGNQTDTQHLMNPSPATANGMDSRLGNWLKNVQENSKKRKHAASPKPARQSRSKADLKSMISDDDETMCQTSKIYRASSKSRSRSVSPKPSYSKNDVTGEELLFGGASQTPKREDSDTEENEMAQKKKQRFVGNIPVDTQGKRINEKINFDLIERAKFNRLNDSDLLRQPPSPSLDGSQWEPRYPENNFDNFWCTDDDKRLPISSQRRRPHI
ncbi:Oidioi.mRNA.OKI2018_I69.PAR.g11771.t1.cds [Oikopleura dioica]|uniref:Oidioi.mRNA.OKI2018_I69.PAR.g11771.t1.cds n=1 Tax=Oikopleura dioica TaxID=34765 RepID=A0ABN7S3I6_OIKDI|nr:Oidioi.mRNA.OKI2018_I69.PAR.g11771.t1.cds [Oikopleura dioica]